MDSNTNSTRVLAAAAGSRLPAYSPQPCRGADKENTPPLRPGQSIYQSLALPKPSDAYSPFSNPFGPRPDTRTSAGTFARLARQDYLQTPQAVAFSPQASSALPEKSRRQRVGLQDAALSVGGSSGAGNGGGSPIGSVLESCADSSDSSSWLTGPFTPQDSHKSEELEDDAVSCQNPGADAFSFWPVSPGLADSATGPSDSSGALPSGSASFLTPNTAREQLESRIPLKPANSSRIPKPSRRKYQPMCNSSASMETCTGEQDENQQTADWASQDSQPLAENASTAAGASAPTGKPAVPSALEGTEARDQQREARSGGEPNMGWGQDFMPVVPSAELVVSVFLHAAVLVLAGALLFSLPASFSHHANAVAPNGAYRALPFHSWGALRTSDFLSTDAIKVSMASTVDLLSRTLHEACSSLGHAIWRLMESCQAFFAARGAAFAEARDFVAAHWRRASVAVAQTFGYEEAQSPPLWSTLCQHLVMLVKSSPQEFRHFLGGVYHGAVRRFTIVVHFCMAP
mmetsp:Transcript_44662/g.115576  ORF Transcript_44662/g.115576 Transcript_44662/m.115576 type:complete len:516 (-) Transcript_44662:77-1624(-)